MDTIGNDRLRSLAEGWAHTAATLVSDCSLAGSQYSANCTDTAVAMEELVRLRAENEQLQSELTALRRELRKLGQANQNLSNRCAALGEEISCAGITADKLQAEIARLSSPPPERADIAGRLASLREIKACIVPGSKLETCVSDIDTLLQDLARARNALNDRVRMLGIVQDSLSERNRQNVELRAKCERLEKESINADGDLQLRDERIEQLQGALRKIRRWEMPETGRTWDDGSPMSYFAVWGSNGERDVILGIAAEALAASQHTAGSPLIPAPEQSLIETARRSPRIVDPGELRQHTAGSGDGVAGD